MKQKKSLGSTNNIFSPHNSRDLKKSQILNERLTENFVLIESLEEMQKDFIFCFVTHHGKFCAGLFYMLVPKMISFK